MDRENLENLDEESLFQIQNTISEIIKERNFKKGDIEAIVDDSFNVAFPKIDGVYDAHYQRRSCSNQLFEKMFPE